jgi:hypothetical protein
MDERERTARVRRRILSVSTNVGFWPRGEVNWVQKDVRF